MASVRCENCNCRIGFMSFRKTAYVLVDSTTGYKHHFCSPTCSDLWCNEQVKNGYVFMRDSEKWKRENEGFTFSEGKCLSRPGERAEEIPTNRFTCPGCGQGATAGDSSVCPNCQQFVHHDCARKSFVTWYCPVCDVGLVGQS